MFENFYDYKAIIDLSSIADQYNFNLNDYYRDNPKKIVLPLSLGLEFVEVISPKNIIINLDQYLVKKVPIQSQVFISTEPGYVQVGNENFVPDSINIGGPQEIVNNIEFVREICKNSNILFIEDCAHALGSKYKNMYTGTFGDAAFFSLQKTKMVTTYAGGILTVNNENINKYVKKNFNNLTYIDSLKEKKMIYQIINSYFKHHIIIKYFYKRIKRLVVNNLSSISKKISYYLIDPLKEEKSAEINGDMSKSYLEILPNKLLLILKMQINNLDKDVERRNFYSEEIIQIMSEIGLKIPDYDRKIIYPSWNRLPFQVKSRENLILVLNKLQIPYSLWFDNPLYQSNEKTRLLNNYNKELYPCSKKVSEHIINLTVSRSVNWYYIKKLKKISDSFN